jgi:hypothetical protein
MIAIVLLSMVPEAWAQANAASEASPVPAVTLTPDLDIDRLPIAFDRIQRQLRQTREREQRDGLNLSYSIQVYALAPPFVLFTSEDAPASSLVPIGAPTHGDMFNAIGPEAHRASTAMAFRRSPGKNKKSGRRVP